MDNNKRIVKNSIFLYFRMLFNVCINLYISRIILDILGVSDYGIYNIVGCIVVLLGFINSSLSGASSRFITFAIGTNDKNRLNETANSSVKLHLFISLIVFVISETIGLWLVNLYLDIPQDRVFAANCVYQFSILTTLFSINQVPYSALVISFEKMNVYAYIEILYSLLKLCSCLVLLYISFDRLIGYGLFLCLSAIMIFTIYRLYSRKFHITYNVWGKNNYEVIRPMLSFCSWDFIGWGGFSISSQGKNIFINRFFGVLLNAANGVAASAGYAVSAFANNVVMAFRPQIIKLYASHQISKMQSMVSTAITLCGFLIAIVVVPLLINLDFIMSIWLKEVPPYASIFCKLLLISNSFEVYNSVIKIGIHAVGKMKNFTITSFVLNISCLILVYAAFAMGADVVSAYYITVLTHVLILIADCYYLKKYINEIDIRMVSLIIIVSTVCITLDVMLVEYAISYIYSNVIKLMSSVLLNTSIVAIVGGVLYKDKLVKLINKYR